MNDFYKYGFWLIIACLVTGSNYFIISNFNYETKLMKLNSFYEKRIESLISVYDIENKNLNEVTGFEIISEVKETDLLKDTTLAILLNTFKCNKCQENEILKLDSLNRKFSTSGFNIIGITLKKKRIGIALQKKRLKIKMPIYYVADSTFLNQLAFTNEFPQIIMVKNNQIVSGIRPIVKDLKFTDLYYNKIFSNK